MIYCTGISGTIGKHLQGRVKSLDIDLTSPKSNFEKIQVEPNSTIIHLAAIVGEKLVINNENYAEEVNIKGTIKIANLARETQSNLIFISTGHVYKPSNSDLSEDSEIKPISKYAQQKLEAEKSIFEILEGSKYNGTVLRVFSLLDFGMPEFTLGGAAEKISSDVNSSPLKYSDDVRDFLTPKQVAEAIYLIAQKEPTDGVFNLASGSGSTVREAILAMFDSTHFDVKVSNFEKGNSTVPRIVANVHKIKNKYPDLQLDWPYKKSTTSKSWFTQKGNS